MIGLAAGVAYAFLAMLIVTRLQEVVSVAYIFIVPVVLGAIPVLLSTKEQLKSYWNYLLLPWGITITFFVLSFVSGFEGMICLVIIVAPFLLLGTLGAFVFRLIKLRQQGKQTPLYATLLLPFAFVVYESQFPITNQFYTVATTIEINARHATVWENVKNVKHIQPEELKTHFVHLIGVPKPLNGELDKEGIGGVRSITWEKGIQFKEVIKSWNSGKGFTYDIHVDPASIPPATLDEHVMIGGRYFDVVEGGYQLDSLAPAKTLLTLTCTYRVTTNLNLYSKLWADFILDDFNKTILEVIKNRSE